MAKQSDEALIKIVTGPDDVYQPEAMAAAKREFEKRKLSAEKIAETKEKIEEVEKVKSHKAGLRLALGWRLLAFFFPGVLILLLSGLLKTEGYEKKAQDLATWTIYGFGFYLGLVILFTVSRM
ncbi:MAG TPA: hypothetical protein DIW47_13020 [Bacteroidetes bacterium]|nr:hypothetical protein [Bacteroidota bacterium]